MYEHFPDNYGWSLSVLMALGMGAPISEVDRACRRLLEISGGGRDADLEWMDAFSSLGDHYVELASEDEADGRFGLAGMRFLRAAAYLLLAERQVTDKNEVTLAVYRRGIDSFRKGVGLRGDPVEFVSVPYDSDALPALFIPAIQAADPRPAPCMLHFDGLDVMKELLYLLGASRLARYGVSTLICDHPGVGEARRLRGLPARYDVERPASACVDYLERRGDVDPSRIGIMALSLGGYYAPRAAAFEPRFKCCVLWGAVWDAVAMDHHQHDGGASSVNLEKQFAWVFDTDPATAIQMLEQFRLEPIMDRIKCPILIVHGEDDRQAPVWAAEKTYEAALASPWRELKIFRVDEGASAHCQIDDLASGTEYMFGWIANALESGSSSRVVAAPSESAH